MKKITIFFSLVIFSLTTARALLAQEIVTASEFFDFVSAGYQQITDYQAHIVISQDDSVMEGTLYHKRPNYLLIEFSVPEEQIIAVDGEKLIIYIPYLNVVMEQELKKREFASDSLIDAATSRGLELMMSRYSVAYLDSQDAVDLDEENDEQVRKLQLEWRSIDEGFRQITLSISNDLLIRRIVGVTAGFEEIQLDFTDVLINQNIPEGKFKYEPPASANIIYNFIFDPDE